MKFFEIIPPGTKFPFVRAARYFIVVSIVLILASIGAMFYNASTKGSPLNFGIDFAGGSSVRLALTKEVPIQEVREALDAAGYQGASAVTVPDADNQVLVHVKDVASIEKAEADACKVALEGYGKAKLKRFSYTEGASKIFLVFEAQPTYAELDEILLKAGCEGKTDKSASSASARRSRTTSTRRSAPAPSARSCRPRRSAPRSATSSRPTASSRCSTRSASSSST
jgi:preprotein translocase subunit SecF